MPSDIYLNLAGINGETQADGLENYIALDSYGISASSPADIGNKGLSAGKV